MMFPRGLQSMRSLIAREGTAQLAAAAPIASGSVGTNTGPPPRPSPSHLLPSPRRSAAAAPCCEAMHTSATSSSSACFSQRGNEQRLAPQLSRRSESPAVSCCVSTRIRSLLSDRSGVRACASSASGAPSTSTSLPLPTPPPSCPAPAASLSAAARESGAALDMPPPHLLRMKVNFCRQCGSPMQLISLGKGDWRHVCSSQSCGYIDYLNPKMVVGCIVEHEGQILMCRRAIEPCRGKWTVPAGFMELNESTAEGAARETWEEANAVVDILAPYIHWDLPAIGQAYILFRAKLAAPFTFTPGTESLETRLFAPHEIPFDDMAFSSVSTSLNYYLQDMQAGVFPMHHGVIDKVPGSSFNDPTTFCVRSHSTLPLSSMDYGSGNQ